MKYNMKLEDIINEFLDEDSPAAQQARQMGLVYKQFGRWADPKSGIITHQTKNGKLVQVRSPESVDRLKKNQRNKKRRDARRAKRKKELQQKRAEIEANKSPFQKGFDKLKKVKTKYGPMALLSKGTEAAFDKMTHIFHNKILPFMERDVFQRFASNVQHRFEKAGEVIHDELDEFIKYAESEGHSPRTRDEVAAMLKQNPELLDRFKSISKNSNKIARNLIIGTVKDAYYAVKGNDTSRENR